MKNVCGYNKQDLVYIRQFIKEINNEIVVRISPSGTWECSLPKYRIYLGAKKILMIVPSIQLVTQGYNDFKEYA